MSRKDTDRLTRFTNITVACGVTVMFVLFASCSGAGGKRGTTALNRDSLPNMITTGVSSLISDSGVIRYKVIAEEWITYDRTDPPRWDFLKGLFIQKYDTAMNVDARIKADTAFYYNKQKLWELRGHVRVRNQQGEKFDTSLLFWDETNDKVYSDQYIRIQQEEKIITGIGFTSNQNFTDYVIYRSTGIFPVEEKDPVDEAPTDTVSPKPASSGFVIRSATFTPAAR